MATRLIRASSIAIPKVGRHEESPVVALGHELHGDAPAFNHLPWLEVDRAAVGLGRVKLGAIGQHTAIVAQARRRSARRLFLSWRGSADLLVLQSIGQYNDAFTPGIYIEPQLILREHA